MQLINSDGHPISIQLCQGKQPHKIDNNPDNYLEQPAVIYIPANATGNLKVMHSNGKTTTYTDFAGQFFITAIKIWADGTTFDHSLIFFAR